MNRQRFLDRDFQDEGSQRAQQLALALAAKCDSEFLESLVNSIGALQEFGGQVFIAAARDHFGPDGQQNDVNEPGRWLTYGYLLHFGDKPTIKRLQTDEEAEQFSSPSAVDEEQPTDLEPVGA